VTFNSVHVDATNPSLGLIASSRFNFNSDLVVSELPAFSFAIFDHSQVECFCSSQLVIKNDRFEFLLFLSFVLRRIICVINYCADGPLLSVVAGGLFVCGWLLILVH